eukprot:GHUV01022564.1.p2 GENE.GHUV01022564.1~~GHUV01022564.1.p2  ORF type:complete len:102 (-),score=23.25 GHUV01022564.1:1383-1688(-)
MQPCMQTTLADHDPTFTEGTIGLCCCCEYPGGFPVVLDNLWLGSEESQAVASALVPKLQKTKVAVEQLLFEVATLEVRYAVRIEAHAAYRQLDVLSRHSHV